MKFLTETAKNGDKTIISESSIYYHSKYNPSKESEKWISSIICDFNPSYIVIIGCGIPYCKKDLIKRFPDSKIYFFFFDSYFLKFINKSDEYFLYTINDINFYSEMFFNLFGEEDCSKILWLDWTPCNVIFSTQLQIIHRAIQQYIEKSKSVIFTRMFFTKKWINNSLRFLTQITKTVTKLSVEGPIIIAASGGTLADSFDFLKTNRNKFTLLAVSSAILPLIKNSIYPDLIISTDGGYWAKKHLDVLVNKNLQIPIICSSESAIPYSLYNQSIFLPIIYPDVINEKLFSLSSIKGINSNRNGTVSGNACEIALQLTKENILTVGLDLSITKSFTNTQPNNLEIANSTKDNKIHNLETRISVSYLRSSSMNIYRNWFESLPKSFSDRIFRLCKDNKTLPNLGNIKTISFSESKINFKKQKKICINSIKLDDNQERKLCLLNYFSSIINNLKTENINLTPEIIDWMKSADLATYLQYNKNKNTDLLLKIKTNTISFLNDIITSCKG